MILQKTLESKMYDDARYAEYEERCFVDFIGEPVFDVDEEEEWQ